MAFAGIGGGVNLGAATGYLFIDARGMGRGLKSADSALGEFERATAARAQAIATAAARNNQSVIDTADRMSLAQERSNARIANAQARRAKSVSEAIQREQTKIQALQKKATATANAAAKSQIFTDPAQQQRLVQLADDVAKANARASKSIEDGYARRQRAVQGLSDATVAQSARIVEAEAAVAAAFEKRALAEARLNQINKELLATDDLRTKRSLGGQKTQASRKLGLADTDVVAAQDALFRLKSDVQNVLQSAMLSSKGVIIATLAEETAALEATSVAIKAQAAEYMRLGQVAGPAAANAAAAVEKSANRVATAAAKVAAINDQIMRHRAASSELEGGLLEKAANKEAQLLVRRQKLVQDLDTINADHVRKSEQLTQKLISLGETEAAAAVAAANAVAQAQIDGALRVNAVRGEGDAAVLAEEKAGQDAQTKIAAAGSAERVEIARVEAEQIAAAEKAMAAARQSSRAAAIDTGMKVAGKTALVLGVAVLAATASFANFDEQMHNVASISANASIALGDMRDRVQELAVEMGQTPEELSKALYDIVSSGFDGAEALTILNASSKAAVAGLSSVESTGKSLTAVLNAYKNSTNAVAASQEGLAKISDIAFQAVKDGVFSFQELTDQQGDNLAIAAELNISYAELNAAYVVLTRQGNKLSESTTQINGIMRTFLKPNEELAAAIEKYGEEVFHVSGLTGTALIQQKGFGEALKFVSEATEGDTAALARLFPNIRALRGEVGLGGKNLAFFNLELIRLNRASENGGATNRALAQQMQSFNFQMRQVREQIRQTATAIGVQLAPGVLLAAKAVGTIVGSFNSLPPTLQSAIGGFIGFGFVVSASIVALGKIVGAIRNAKTELKAFKIALAEMRTLKLAFAALSNPIVAAGIGIGVLTLIALNEHRKHEQAVKELKKSYEELELTIKNLGDAGVITAEDQAQLTAFKNNIDAGITSLEGQTQSIAESRFELNKLIAAAEMFGDTTVQFNGKTLSLDDARKQVELYEHVLGGVTSGTADAARATDEFTQVLLLEGVDLEKVLNFLDPYIKGIDAGTSTVGDLADKIHYINLNQAEFGAGTTETTQKLARLGSELDTLDEFFGTADERADAFRKSMQGIVQTAEIAAGAMDDFSSPLAFIQQKLGDTGESVAQTIGRLDDLGAITLTDFQRSAVDAVSALDAAQKKIDDLNVSIKANQDQMSQWQNIVSLVGDTVGTAANGYQQLNDMVARGKITQAEANKIQEAAIFLNERAKAGIEDERVEIAKSLPNLAAFVHEHDLANDQFEKLSPAAKGFASAMSDTRTQAILLAAIMVKLANALNEDAFPDEFVTKFFLDITSVDPATTAVLDSLGLIPEEVTTQILITSDSPDLKLVQAEQQKILDQIDAINLAASNRATGILSTDEVKKVAELNKQWNDLETVRKRVANQTDAGFIGHAAGPPAVPEFDSGLKDEEAEVDAITQAFIDAESGANDFTDAVGGALPELIKVASGVADISDPFKFLQKQLHITTDSMSQLLLRSSQAGKIKFDGAERAALSVQAKLDGVNRGLASIGETIQQNEQDMSMWQGRIDLIDATIGTATDTYAAYEQQLISGQISQEEFNAAVASGEAHRAYAELNQLVESHRLTQEQADRVLFHSIHLRERSVGGILDERAAQALAIIDLDNYVTKHDHLNKSYNDLTSEQKGFLKGLEDEAVQTALNTFLMLSFLEAMGGVAAGTAGKFAETVGAANDTVGAIFEGLSILENGKFVIHLDAETTPADTKIAQTKEDAAKPVDFTVTSRGDGTGIVGDQGIPEDTSVTVTANTEPAKTALAALTQYAVDQVAFMLEAGTSAGIAFVDGEIAGIEFRTPDLITASNYLLVTLANYQRFRTTGQNAGVSYDYGVAEGVYRASPSVASAGGYLAALLHASFLRGLFSRSPSRKGMEGGVNYVDGVIIGLMSATGRAKTAAASVAKGVHEAFTDESRRLSATGLGDMSGGLPVGMTRGSASLTRVSGAPKPVGTTTVIQNNKFGDQHISGAGDPKAVADEVHGGMWDQFVDAWRRIETAVG